MHLFRFVQNQRTWLTPYQSGKDADDKNVKIEVWIKMTGARGTDDTAAKNKAINDLGVTNWDDLPDGTWHHVEGVYIDKDANIYCKMQYVSKEIHDAFKHNGAVQQHESIRKVKYE